MLDSEQIMKTAQNKIGWYEKSTRILNKLIKKHPCSILLFDFFKGKLVAKSTDRRKILNLCRRLSKTGSGLIIHEPKKNGVSDIYLVTPKIPFTRRHQTAGFYFYKK